MKVSLPEILAYNHYNPNKLSQQSVGPANSDVGSKSIFSTTTAGRRFNFLDAPDRDGPNNANTYSSVAAKVKRLRISQAISVGRTRTHFQRKAQHTTNQLTTSGLSPMARQAGFTTAMQHHHLRDNTADQASDKRHRSAMGLMQGGHTTQPGAFLKSKVNKQSPLNKTF